MKYILTILNWIVAIKKRFYFQALFYNNNRITLKMSEKIVWLYLGTSFKKKEEFFPYKLFKMDQ
jgi:hypothetical protein